MLSYDHMNAYGDDSAGRELEKKEIQCSKSLIFDDFNCDVEFVLSKCVEVDMCKNL